MNPRIHATTILAVRCRGQTAIGGDGQVTIGQTAVKHDTNKIRRLGGGKVLCGFAGSAADAFACWTASKTSWRSSRATSAGRPSPWPRTGGPTGCSAAWSPCWSPPDAETSLIISGSGDVIEPSDGTAGIGSGGMYAAAAARALLKHTPLPAAEVVRESLLIAADICVYTNSNLTIETL